MAHAARQLGTCKFVTDPRRKSPRKCVNLNGEISLGDKTFRLNCQILDMSATGARISIDPEHGNRQSEIDRAYDRIGLFFDRRRTNVECNVVWMNGRDIGVQFTSSFRQAH